VLLLLDWADSLFSETVGMIAAQSLHLLARVALGAYPLEALVALGLDEGVSGVEKY
jgi:hypothetical protein